MLLTPLFASDGGARLAFTLESDGDAGWDHTNVTAKKIATGVRL